MISVMVHLNPSGTVSLYDTYGSEGLLTGIQVLGALVIFFLLFTAGSTKKVPRFLFMFFSSFLFTIVLATSAGLIIHRDYYSFFMQSFLAHTILFLYKMEELSLIKNRAVTYRALYIGSVVLTVLTFSWLIIVSYAIVVRLEPRWIESTWYNIINALFGFLLLWTASVLRDRRKKTITVSQERVLLDGNDLTGSLSPQELNLLTIFLIAGNTNINCSTLLKELRENTLGQGGEKSVAECLACIENGWPPSKCASYRNLKNRINDIKKYLELLQIGTIVPVSKNPREVKEQGWRFRLFDDVRIGP